MEKHSYLYRQGYRFYVYVGPGNISYFFTRESADIFASKNGVKAQDLD
jgi:hypothetical protein